MSLQRIHKSPAARTQAYRERQKAAGLQRIEVRLDAQTLEQLARLRPDFGVASVAQVIETIVHQLWGSLGV